MSHEPLKETWLMERTEDFLAGFQQDQGRSNDCSEYAAAAALNLLFGKNISGLELDALANRGWLLKGLRAWPDGPTTPGQQARLIRTYARQEGLAVEARARKATTLDLRRWLGKPDLACLVTIAWDNRRPVKMMKNFGEASLVNISPFFWSGHTMLLAAFVPALPENQLTKGRWGFINSWAEPESRSIYWMEDDEFKRCWNYPFFPIGKRNVVVVKRLFSVAAASAAF